MILLIFHYNDYDSNLLNIGFQYYHSPSGAFRISLMLPMGTNKMPGLDEHVMLSKHGVHFDLTLALENAFV